MIMNSVKNYNNLQFKCTYWRLKHFRTIDLEADKEPFFKGLGGGT